jgi:competence protein ComEC
VISSRLLCALRHPPVPHGLALAFCLGLAGSLAWRPSGAAVIVAAAGAACAAVALPRARAMVLAAALACAGLWWGAARLDDLDRSVLSAEVGDVALARVEVTGPTRSGEFDRRVPVRVRDFDGREVDERAQLELPARERAPPQGAVLELVVRVVAPERGEDGSFDEEGYLRRLGMHVVLRASSYRVVGHRRGVAGLGDSLRSALAGTIAPGLEGERAALVAGIVLGEDEGLDDDLRDRFRASGLYHLLAVSGQNVAYVVAGVLLLAWLAGLPRVAAQLAAIVGILGYVFAVGWQPSVVRAGIAGILACAAWMAARPRDRWYFLLVGAAILLAWNPYALLDPGFQLSFAAVAAIFVIVPLFESRLEGYPVPRVLASVIAVSAACGLATAPITWFHFGAIPVLSVFANALAAPVVAPILAFGLGAAALGPIVPGAAFALGWINGHLVAYLAGCARLVGGIPFAQVGSPLALAAIAAVLGLVVALLRCPRAWRMPLVVSATALVGAGAAWALWPAGPALPPPAGLRISFLDVGQGDGILLQVPEGAVLVDQGPPEARVGDVVRDLGVRRIDLLVLTHPQRDHIGGAADVLRETRVVAVLDPRQPNPSPYEDEALDVAADRSVRVLAARVGQRYRVGRLTLRVVWPDGPGLPGQDPNEHPIVLLATYGSVDALLTADAESGVTGRLPLPPVEILKVAHHGSADDGLPALLERLRPRVAVISVGTGNDYGHPAPSTLAALSDAASLRLFRTDRDGTVIVETDGRRIEVRTAG